MTDLPASDECTSQLLSTHFPRHVAWYLKGFPTVMEKAELFLNHVFRNFGLPEEIVSDRGPQFMYQVWKAFFSLLCVTIRSSSGYHLQTNGQIGRKIQEIEQFLTWAKYAQNYFCQPETGLTLFQCILGGQPPLFPWDEESLVPAGKARLLKLECVQL